MPVTRTRTAYSELTETELARRCAERDPGALGHLMAVNNQRLFRTAWSILRDRTEAEDVVQATYLSALRNMAAFAGRSSLSTWLTRIAINEALGRQRAYRRRQDQLEKQGVAVFDCYRDRLMRGSDPLGPDALAAREQLRLLLERAVGELSEPFRTVFVLREIEEMSVEETAAALDIPPATVKTRLLRARRRLQQILSPEVRGVLVGSFPFAGADCAALTERVMSALGVRTSS